MNVSNKYKIFRTGIGDLIFFCSHIIHNNIEELSVSISDLNIKNWKNEEYRNFCHDFIKKMLWNKKLEITNDQNYPEFTVDWTIINSALINPTVINHFKNIFYNSLEEKAKNSIIISTKVRSYPREAFDFLSKTFFSSINGLNKKIILIGEKEVEYGLEYQTHGKNSIYSIYSDCIKNINPNLIEDLTIPKLGITNPNLDNIIKDMNLVMNSERVIMFGCGGFFCTSLFTNKLCSLITPDNTCNFFPTQLGKQVFINFENFIENLHLIRLANFQKA